jgi:hypothetical protein
MPLLKPRVMTPARWAAHRRIARKSTGPRTAQTRLNGLCRKGTACPAGVAGARAKPRNS